ncbi:MAG: YafY family protein [Pseudomonadota bacterium]
MAHTTRIYQLHHLFKCGPPVGLKQLMERFEVSKATIKRDIDLLRDQLGAPLVYDREVNGYHYERDAPEFELPGLWFNESELFALLSTEQLLESVQPGLLAPHIGPLKARIHQLLSRTGHDSRDVSSKIILQPIGKRQVDDKLFGVIAGALLDGLVINVEYHGRVRGEKTERRLHPVRMLYYRDNWYLIAWCEKAQALRTFSLERIRQPVVTNKVAQRIDDEKLNTHLHGGFGIFAGAVTDWAVLRFSPRMARWVADEQWHPEQVCHWRDDHYELHIPYTNPTELMMDILKYGSDVEVIAPAALRQLVIERIEASLQRYR